MMISIFTQTLITLSNRVVTDIYDSLNRYKNTDNVNSNNVNSNLVARLEVEAAKLHDYLGLVTEIEPLEGGFGLILPLHTGRKLGILLTCSYPYVPPLFFIGVAGAIEPIHFECDSWLPSNYIVDIVRSLDNI